MELTDGELSALYDLVIDKACYGDDDIVYGDSLEAMQLRDILEKLSAEAGRRGLWWATA